MPKENSTINEDIKNKLSKLGITKVNTEKKSEPNVVVEEIAEIETEKLKETPEQTEQIKIPEETKKILELYKRQEEILKKQSEDKKAIKAKISELKSKKVPEQAEPVVETTAEKVKEEKTEKLEDPAGLKLKKAREAYAETYKTFLTESRKKAGWAKRLKWILSAKSKNKDLQAPENLKKLEAEYNQATIALGNEMYADKKAALETAEIWKQLDPTNAETMGASKMSPEEQKYELDRFKKNEIFTKIIIEEQSLLNALKAENLPVKEKAIWRKALDRYSELPRWKKIAFSTIVSTAVIVGLSSGAVVAGGGVAAYAGTKYVRGLTGSVVGQGAAKAYDWLFKEKSAEKRKVEEQELQAMFADESFDESLVKTQKEYAEILEKEKRAKRERLITKAMITIAAGGLASYEMGGVLHSENVPSEQIQTEVNIQEHPHPAQIAVDSTHVEPAVVHTPPITEQSTTVPTEATPVETPEHIFKSESITFEHGKGGIQGIRDLKTQISHDYPDLSKAPQSVQDFMKETNVTKQAIALGFFDPNSPTGAESAIVLKGSTLSFNENGDLSFHDAGTGHDNTLIHGDTQKIDQYHGKMLDTHKIHAPTPAPVETPETTPSDTPHQIIEPKVLETQQDTTTLNHPTVEKTETGTPHIEAPNNPYGLTPEILNKVDETYETHISHFFPGNTQAWETINNSKDLTAEYMMSVKGADKTFYGPFIHYLNDLQEKTGVKPGFVKVGLFSRPETSAEYVIRAMQFAASKGKLDEITL